MDRFTIRSLAVMLTILCIASLPVIAAQARQSSEIIQGTVRVVDARSGLLKLELMDGKRMTIAASTKLLSQLQAGSKVGISISKEKKALSQSARTSTAVVRKNDPATGLLRLYTDQGEIVDLMPPPGKMVDLQSGDNVLITVSELAEPPQQQAAPQTSQSSQGATQNTSQRQEARQGAAQDARQQAQQEQPDTTAVEEQRAQSGDTETSQSQPQSSQRHATSGQQSLSVADALLVVQMSEVNKVMDIDRASNTLTLETQEGNTVQLLVPDALLQDLQKGDSVKISFQKIVVP